MIVRALDTNHDFTFGKGKQSYKKENDAIMQNIKTRLLSFLNDCFFDVDAGIDWYTLLGKKNTENEIILSCRATILKTEGVVTVNSLSASVNSDRRISINVNLETIYSRAYSATYEITG